MNSRQKSEEIYHDKITKHGKTVAYGYTDNAYYQYFFKLIGEIKGIRVLDLGCGDGWFSNLLAEFGATVTGIDISIELLQKAVKNYKLENKTGPNYVKMAAEDLSFHDETFELVIGSAILHHTNIEISAKEIARVLIPGGRAIFVEPMNENILLKIWRLITPRRRSPNEKALNKQDIINFNKKFKIVKNNFFVFTTIISEGLMIAFPNSKLLKSLDHILASVDKSILKKMPILKEYYGVVVFEGKK